MNWFLNLVQGAAATAANYQQQSPRARRRARKNAEGCTPCAAMAATQEAKSFAQGVLGRGDGKR